MTEPLLAKYADGAVIIAAAVACSGVCCELVNRCLSPTLLCIFAQVVQAFFEISLEKQTREPPSFTQVISVLPEGAHKLKVASSRYACLPPVLQLSSSRSQRVRRIIIHYADLDSALAFFV